jgi:hypothetical protein
VRTLELSKFLEAYLGFFVLFLYHVDVSVDDFGFLRSFLLNGKGVTLLMAFCEAMGFLSPGLVGLMFKSI